ncbi:hypothetical protein EG346_13980 [Chryseobacterium carnipullorum]|jgi:predicted small secreted protein|uniref:Uncharacterized protein n=1 Tax=Chryseobacterium carnipullorum TaxID=1124835 RepID=A0A376DQU7_CHRCU|nr:hypothetical protein [Chryseobacterium carnipullorum]AZA49217.1 hypothetical protein EG346_13980 [Chryseobacterium carnipullorum]AZA64111.1 hypothetical protein EG345_04915 [Chryseobacterium carnipullorum]STC94026.1 Uncharacterised protein [Chryseobacterium carnipullorum]
MKKLALLSAIAVSAFTLSSFTTVNGETKPVKPQGYKVYCADGSYAGSFICDCRAAQVQRIADLMCN